MTRLTLRIDLEAAGSIGPGKVRLLELITETGSIRQAGAALTMSYARAWGLVRDLNGMFAEPVVEAIVGGKSGGGARLTATGGRIVRLYRAVERKAEAASRRDVINLKAMTLRRKPERR